MSMFFYFYDILFFFRIYLDFYCQNWQWLPEAEGRVATCQPRPWSLDPIKYNNHLEIRIIRKEKKKTFIWKELKGVYSLKLYIFYRIDICERCKKKKYIEW
jgi:hypothetical protein